jgi:hypothetical protein
MLSRPDLSEIMSRRNPNETCIRPQLIVEQVRRLISSRTYICAFGLLIKTICSHFVIFYALHTNNGESECSYIGKCKEKPYCPLLCDGVSSEKNFDISEGPHSLHKLKLSSP